MRKNENADVAADSGDTSLAVMQYVVTGNYTYIPLTSSSSAHHNPLLEICLSRHLARSSVYVRF
jgi:hypothetical protein